MILRLAFIASGLALAAPGHAQEVSPSAEVGSLPAGSVGYPLAQTADGFQLVEHGIWEVPSVQASEPATSAKAEPRFAGQTRTATGPNGFHRAAYLPHVYAAEAEFALPAGLLDALIWTESRYNPFAISKAGAAGLGQLMPGSWALPIASTRWRICPVRPDICDRCSTDSAWFIWRSPHTMPGREQWSGQRAFRAMARHRAMSGMSLIVGGLEVGSEVER